MSRKAYIGATITKGYSEDKWVTLEAYDAKEYRTGMIGKTRRDAKHTTKNRQWSKIGRSFHIFST